MARQYGLLGAGAPAYVNETSLREYGGAIYYINETQASSIAYTMSVSVGTFALTGNSINLLVARNLIAATGVFTFTGYSVNLLAPNNVLIDTHDGAHDRQRKKLDDEFRRSHEQRLSDIVSAWDRLAQGDSTIIEALVEEFPLKLAPIDSHIAMPDFNRLLERADAVERLWNAFIELDDEDFLVMM